MATKTAQPPAPPKPAQPAISDETKLRLDKAYTRLILNQPFFATLLMRMRKVIAPWIGTMAVDGRSLFIAPKFVESITDDELTAVLCHEVLHVANLHHLRRGERDPERWNIATDAAINDVVESSGMKLPAHAIRMPQYKGKSPEEIYSLLPANPNSGKGTGQGQGSGSGNGSGQDPCCDPGQCGGVLDQKNQDGSSLTPSQRREAEADQTIATQQAAIIAKRAGKLPAGIDILVDELTDPKVPWREILARFVDQQARNDYSFSRPNRRHIASGFVLPTLYSEEIGKFIFLADTSGSMIGEVGEVAAEVLAVLQQYADAGNDSELTVLWTDTEYHEQVMRYGDKPEVKGGGGTDFRSAMAYCAKKQHDVRAVICYTDGYISDIGDDPGYPVLWILSRSSDKNFSPAFGEIAHMVND